MPSTMTPNEVFKFKAFDIIQDHCTMKVNTDGVMLGAWSDVNGKKKALDIGTGTGVIALMLAQKSEDLDVVGIDIDVDSCRQAEINAKQSKFKDQVEIKEISLQAFAMVSAHIYDLIISNPPFFTGGTFSSNENKANVRHTIKLSHIDLLQSVKKLLHHDGHFDVVLPYLEGLRFVEMAGKYDLYLHRMTEVRSRSDRNIERLLLRFGLSQMPNPIQDSLIVYYGDTKQYTEEFTNLTKAFYLNM